MWQGEATVRESRVEGQNTEGKSWKWLVTIILLQFFFRRVYAFTYFF